MLKQEQSNMAMVRWTGNEYRVWIESVGPERAQKILDTNGDRNRKKRPARIARYAADMRAGKWRLTGEPIRLDDQGLLLNGQHRLAAIVQSGCAVPLFFVSGISPTTMIVQDSGLPVSADDWMPLESPGASTRIVRAVLRAFAPRFSNNISRDEVLTAYNILGAEHIQWAIEHTRTGGACKAAVRAALVLLHRLNPARAETFASRLSKHDLPAGTPENKLHFAMTNRGVHLDEEVKLAVRVVVAIARDEEKGISKLYTASDDDTRWLLKAAKLEKLISMRRAGE